MASYSEMAASTAKSYALVGLIFYILGVVPWLFFLFGVLAVSVVSPGFSPSFPVFPLIIPGLLVLAIPIGFTVWAWITYQNVERGRYEEARTPSLILGIFGIFLAWIIGGIFFLLAYGKLGEAVQPFPAAAAAHQFCVGCGRAVAPGAKFCSHCGKEVPE